MVSEYWENIPFVCMLTKLLSGVSCRRVKLRLPCDNDVTM